jgi:hypothetical protein
MAGRGSRGLSDTKAISSLPLRNNGVESHPFSLAPDFDEKFSGALRGANPNAGEAQNWRSPFRDAGVGSESLRSAVPYVSGKLR